MYYTAQDVADHLISATGGGAQDAEQRDIRAAIHHAYRDLVQIRDWQWHTSHGRVILEPAVTVAVTVSGSGTVLTRASGAWPTDAQYYRAYVDGVVAQVAERTSATVLTLSSTVKFPASFDGSKTVILYRNTYPLPADFGNMDAPVTQDRTSITSYVTPMDFIRIERSILLSGDPVYWTVMRDEASPHADRWAVRVCGYPTESETFDFTYRRRVEPPRYTGYEPPARAGSISSVVSDVVTGSGTSFDAAMAGAVMRIGTSTTVHPEPAHGLTPFYKQAVIKTVDSATQVTLAAGGLGWSVSATAGYLYVVTSLLDLSPSMFSAMLSGAELWLAKMRKGDVQRASDSYARDLRLALEADAVSPIAGRTSDVYGRPVVSYGAAIRRASIAPDVG